MIERVPFSEGNRFDSFDGLSVGLVYVVSSQEVGIPITCARILLISRGFLSVFDGLGIGVPDGVVCLFDGSLPTRFLPLGSVGLSPSSIFSDLYTLFITKRSQNFIGIIDEGG